MKCFMSTLLALAAVGTAQAADDAKPLILEYHEWPTQGGWPTTDPDAYDDCMALCVSGTNEQQMACLAACAPRTKAECINKAKLYCQKPNNCGGVHGPSNYWGMKCGDTTVACMNVPCPTAAPTGAPTLTPPPETCWKDYQGQCPKYFALVQSNGTPITSTNDVSCGTAPCDAAKCCTNLVSTCIDTGKWFHTPYTCPTGQQKKSSAGGQVCRAENENPTWPHLVPCEGLCCEPKTTDTPTGTPTGTPTVALTDAPTDAPTAAAVCNPQECASGNWGCDEWCACLARPSLGTFWMAQTGVNFVGIAEGVCGFANSIASCACPTKKTDPIEPPTDGIYPLPTPVLPTQWCYNFEKQCSDHWVKMDYDTSLFKLSKDACINSVCTVEQCCPGPDNKPTPVELY